MKVVTMAVMVLLLGSGLRYGQRYILQSTGMPAVSSNMKGVNFSSEEADLMTTVFKSAIRLFTGSASRKELAGELSEKLYAGRMGEDSKELGIELVNPADAPSTPGTNGNVAPGKVTAGGASAANSQPGANPAAAQKVRPGKVLANQGMPTLEAPTGPALSGVQATMLTRVWTQTKANSLELTLVPVVLLGMVLVQRVKQRRSMDGDFLPSLESLQNPAETEPYDMKYPAHTLTAEDFEMLVALVYQRQGYRVSMPAGLGGGRGGDFTLARKSERILVQCKKQSQDHKIPVERVRELHEAMLSAGMTRGMYVASCGFSWDARNFAKGKGITVINARTLDALLAAVRETLDENLLAVSDWAPKMMGKVQLTAPTCPACEAAMDQISVSTGSVWVCSQRPDCRGRRSARKYQKSVPAAAKSVDQCAEGIPV